MGKDVVVLRYGHRHVRDYRVTSHCCLVARAFGAEKIVIHGEKDDSIEKTIEGIKRHWGGAFSVEFTESWKKTVEEHKKQGFYVVHATMYGIPIEKEISSYACHHRETPGTHRDHSFRIYCRFD